MAGKAGKADKRVSLKNWTGKPGNCILNLRKK